MKQLPHQDDIYFYPHAQRVCKELLELVKIKLQNFG